MARRLERGTPFADDEALFSRLETEALKVGLRADPAPLPQGHRAVRDAVRR